MHLFCEIVVFSIEIMLINLYRQDYVPRLKWLLAQSVKKWRQGYPTHLYIYGDPSFIGDRAQGYS